QIHSPFRREQRVPPKFIMRLAFSPKICLYLPDGCQFLIGLPRWPQASTHLHGAGKNLARSVVASTLHFLAAGHDSIARSARRSEASTHQYKNSAFSFRKKNCSRRKRAQKITGTRSPFGMNRGVTSL